MFSTLKNFYLIIVLLALMSPCIIAEDNANYKVSGKAISVFNDQSLPNIQLEALFILENDQLGYKQQRFTTNEKGEFQITIPSNAVLMINPPMDMAPRKKAEDVKYILDEQWMMKNGQRPKELKVTKDITGHIIKLPYRQACLIKGVVLDPDGKALPDSQIYTRSIFGQFIKTDDQGLFALNTLKGTDCPVFVRSKDGAFSSLAELDETAEQNVIKLKPSLSFKGRVHTTDGEPAADFRFQLQPELDGTALFIRENVNSYNLTEYHVDKQGNFTAKNLCPDLPYLASWMDKNYHDGQVKIKLDADKPIKFQVKRFIDNWKTKGNIGISPETKISRLTNYWLDNNDRFLACDSDAKAIKVISLEDQLLETWKLDFSPTAIECRKDDTVVVGGKGKIAILDKKGDVLHKADLPGNEATGVGWCGDDVFVAVMDRRGMSLHRFDLQLKQSKQIIDGLAGCCGQMDFTVKDGVIYVAHLGKFKVEKFDREGKLLGCCIDKTDHKDKEVFIGCCEPKNVCFDTEGYLYTADSGKCAVHKWTKDGKYVAKIGDIGEIRSCVRVMVQVTKDCKKVYVMDTGRNIIRLVRP